MVVRYIGIGHRRPGPVGGNHGGGYRVIALTHIGMGCRLGVIADRHRRRPVPEIVGDRGDLLAGRDDHAAQGGDEFVDPAACRHIQLEGYLGIRIPLGNELVEASVPFCIYVLDMQEVFVPFQDLVGPGPAGIVSQNGRGGIQDDEIGVSFLFDHPGHVAPLFVKHHHVLVVGVLINGIAVIAGRTAGTCTQEAGMGQALGVDFVFKADQFEGEFIVVDVMGCLVERVGRPPDRAAGVARSDPQVAGAHAVDDPGAAIQGISPAREHGEERVVEQGIVRFRGGQLMGHGSRTTIGVEGQGDGIGVG